MRYLGAGIVLFTAFVLSSIAAIMSITGMMALFPAHAVVVAIMMGGLELGKIVASGWLKVYWNDALVPMLHKAYLVVATIVLMIITSLGIFGYLSAGHNEQTAPLANVNLQIAGYERQIAQKTGEVKRLEDRVAQIDRNIEAFISQDRATSGLRASQTLKKERETLQGQIETGYKTINELNNKLLPFKEKTNEVEAKLGPIQNVADFFGWTDSDSAVRFIIGMIMLVFDPLAIVLMISGLITLNNIRNDEKLAREQALRDEEDMQWKQTFLNMRGALSVEDQCEAVEETSDASETVPETVDEENPDVSEELDELINQEETEEETFEIVRSLDSKLSEEPELEGDETDIHQDETEAHQNDGDHRERLIQLLQSEPEFLKEVEQVIEQIALERVAQENEKIRGGYQEPTGIRSYGADHPD